MVTKLVQDRHPGFRPLSFRKYEEERGIPISEHGAITVDSDSF